MTYFLTWLALMSLLAATTASSFVNLGPWNTVLNFAIACAKAGLVAAVFMQLRGAGGLVRLVAAIGLVMLAALFGLSGTDYATRAPGRAAWEAPGGSDEPDAPGDGDRRDRHRRDVHGQHDRHAALLTLSRGLRLLPGGADARLRRLRDRQHRRAVPAGPSRGR
jgi:cytochrome c oxidase subunit 4